MLQQFTACQGRLFHHGTVPPCDREDRFPPSAAATSQRESPSRRSDRLTDQRNKQKDPMLHKVGFYNNLPNG